MVYTIAVSVKRTKAVWRPVKCSHCGCEFLYHLVRSASAGATGGFLSDSASLADRADTDAYRRLHRQMMRGVEPFRCPECRLYQPNMVAVMRIRFWKKTMLIASIAAVAIAFGLAFLFSSLAEPGTSKLVYDHLRVPPALYVWWTWAAVAVVTTVWAVLWNPDSAPPESIEPTPDGAFRRADFERLKAEAEAAGTPLDAVVPPMGKVFHVRLPPAE